MDIARLAETTQDTLTVRKVFGEAYERDGTSVIPAATIRGGAGGGGSRRTGSGAKDQEGEGGGFSINAAPAGVYVLSAGKVRWVPALDVNRVVLGGQLVGLATILVTGLFLARRARAAS